MDKQQLIEKASLYYGDDGSDFEWITEGFQNIVLKCIHQGHTIFLRIVDSNRRSLEMLEAELEWLELLTTNHVPVPTPVKSHNGDIIEEVFMNDKTWYLIGFTQVKGRPIDVTVPEIWNTNFFKKWGETLGQIHSISPKKLIKRPTLEESTSLSETIDYLLKEESEEIKESLIKTLAEIKRLSYTEKNFGLIHNDFHQGNILFDGNVIGVIDFDESAYGWYAQDIAVSLYHAYWQATEIAGSDHTFSKTYLDEFLKGYEKFKVIDPEMIEQIPLFLRWRDLFLFALFLKNWPLDSLEIWQEETLKNLRKRIVQNECYVPSFNIGNQA